MADTLAPVPATAPSDSPRPRTVAEIIDDEVARGVTTLTPLGKVLLEARREIERRGELAADADELARDKAERKGGVEARLAAE